MDRRTFLKTTGMVMVAPMVTAGPKLQFQYTLLQHGTHWAERKRALTKLSFEVRKRCNIPIESEAASIGFDRVLHAPSPFFILSGKGPLPDITMEQGSMMRTCLNAGGALIFDHQGDDATDGFYASAVNIVAKIYPDLNQHIIPNDHSVYQSYYLLKEARGRLNAKSFMEGWSLADHTVVFYSHNDLLGALESDRSGNWTHNMEFGGGFRRELCFRLGINLTYYVLTLNYKKDRAFPPVIKRRRRQ